MTKDEIETLKSKLVSRVEKREGDCWEWVGPLNATGYGVFSSIPGIRSAHRASFRIHRGEIPSGMNVCHACDNRACVNPEHLFLGSQQDNMRDMWSKNRGARGPRIPQTKLTESQVLEIARSSEPRRVLAARFGISVTQIKFIKLGRSWRWLTGLPYVRIVPKSESEFIVCEEKDLAFKLIEIAAAAVVNAGKHVSKQRT